MFPSQAFYQNSIDSGLRPGMTLEEIITSLTIALGQANDDRRQIKDWVLENSTGPHR
jgi:hypothetical protein